jgi:cell division protein FtsB
MLGIVNSGTEWLYRVRRKLATAGIGVVLCVVGYHAVFGANGLMVYEQKRRESRELDRQIKALQQQNGGMEQEIKALKSDPKTIEKEARERLRYARPGEVVYTLPAAPPPSTKDRK